MKKIIKSMSLFLAAALSVGIFAACDSTDSVVEGNKKEEKTLTIEEIFNTFNDTENGKLSMYVTSEATDAGSSALMTVNMEYEQAGDLAHSVTTTVLTVNGQEYTNVTKELY